MANRAARSRDARLFNDEHRDSGEKAKLFSSYLQYVNGQSLNRHSLFGHFITIHLFLLPAHAALLSKGDLALGVLYSVLVAILGVTICVVSYHRIRGIFVRTDAGYQILEEIEQDLPYRFIHAVTMRVSEGELGGWFGFRRRRMELVMHWIIGSIYASLPVVHYNLGRITRLLE